MAKAGWDFRLNVFRPSDDQEVSYEVLGNCLYQLSKSFVFQKEKGGENGYEHYQGRLSLRGKTTKSSLLNKFMKLLKCGIEDAPNYLMPTAEINVGRNNFSYVMKEDTRIDGPWKDSDFDPGVQRLFIPDHLKSIMTKMRPFQQYIYDHRADKEPRLVNVLYNRDGNIGKSDLCDYLRITAGGFLVPPYNDFEKIIQSVCNYAMDKGIREITPLMIDMPRAMAKDRLSQFYQAIETLKRGRLFDTRYHYVEYNINIPVVWVFTNTLPDQELLSMDMWKIWEVDDDFELIPYVPDDPDLDYPCLKYGKRIIPKYKASDEVSDDSDADGRQIQRFIKQKKSYFNGIVEWSREVFDDFLIGYLVLLRKVLDILEERYYQLLVRLRRLLFRLLRVLVQHIWQHSMYLVFLM